MRRSDLIEDLLSSDTLLSRGHAERVVDQIIYALSGALASGEDVQLAGLGTLAVVHRAARSGHNPQTGNAIQIPASKAVKFRAAKSLRERLNA